MTTIANVLAKMKWQAKDTALVRRSSHLFQFCMVLLPLLTPRIAPAQESSSRTQKSGQQLMARNENGGKDVQNALPIVSDVQAAGLTPMQLAASVTAELRKYLADPRVTVVVTQINSQRIYVLGEVNKAGTYALFPGMTLLQALSSAGGFNQFADVKKIYP